MTYTNRVQPATDDVYQQGTACNWQWPMSDVDRLQWLATAAYVSELPIKHSSSRDYQQQQSDGWQRPVATAVIDKPFINALIQWLARDQISTVAETTPLYVNLLSSRWTFNVSIVGWLSNIGPVVGHSYVYWTKQYLRWAFVTMPCFNFYRTIINMNSFNIHQIMNTINSEWHQ